MPRQCRTAQFTLFWPFCLKGLMIVPISHEIEISSTLYLDFGDCTYSFQFCGALFWLNEKSNESTQAKFNLCCKNGKIELPLLKETPSILDNLLNYYGGSKSTYYRKNICTFNLMLAFTSFGANIETTTTDSHGRQIHHLLGSLL